MKILSGEQLKDYRISLFLTRKQLADRVHVSPYYIEKLEKGTRRVTPEMEQVITRAFKERAVIQARQLVKIMAEIG